MNKNDLYKNKESIYRVLAIGERILIIDCIKQNMPFFVDNIRGDSISEKELQLETGVILDDVDRIPPNAKKVVYKRYTIIAPIIAVIDDKPRRSSMICYVSEKYNLSKQTIRTYLCRFLSYQNISVLAPNEKTERELTTDEKNIRWALNKYYYTRNKNSLKIAYEMMLKADM